MKHGNRFARRLSIATTLVGTIALASAPARADLVLQGVQKAPGLQQGASVPDDHLFDLPEGATLNLLQTPSGQNFQMRGPFKGTLQAFTKDCNGWLAFTKAYCAAGGGDQLPVGGTRGVQR